ncbi:hypothetical protein ACFPIJ_56540 [Dactylosporangium cerinum]|uniref:Uncharacterized protein n=1 Tax=Dactylosporangium cerinum TaxID=1434730 RepID=A0ABV9WGN5_9ACTN
MTFETYADGDDPDRAFNTARRDAVRDCGHGGYTGTIAEKTFYVIVTDTVTDLDEAEALAADLLDRDDPRLAGTWGPAGAIPVRQTIRTVRVDNLSGTWTGYTLNQPDLNRAAGVAHARGQLAPGEAVTAGRPVSASRAEQPPSGPLSS